MIKKILFIAVFSALVLPNVVAQEHKGESRNIVVNGSQRNFVFFTPGKVNSPMPLVIALHANGGTSKGFEKYTGFSDLAAKEKFMVMYPQGCHNTWNVSGMQPVGDIKNTCNDLSFIKELVLYAIKECNADKDNIFLFGYSRGGAMALHVSDTLAKMFRGMALVSSSITTKRAAYFGARIGLPVLLMNGTADPVIPYEGGNAQNTDLNKNYSYLHSDSLLQMFLKVNECNNEPIEAEIPDKDKEDGASALSFTWKSTINNTEIMLVKVNGGGQGIPGCGQYQAKRYIGSVCNDFNGSRMAWEFFKRNSKQ
jgi:polyhydroxybutyrate depolymerase